MICVRWLRRRRRVAKVRAASAFNHQRKFGTLHDL